MSYGGEAVRFRAQPSGASGDLRGRRLGVGTNALFYAPSAIAVINATTLLIADANQILTISSPSRAVALLAGCEFNNSAGDIITRPDPEQRFCTVDEDCPSKDCNDATGVCRD
jgi:hypothetical protein